MASFNRVTLIGNLTRDPELKYLPSGSAIANFGLAINRTWTKDGQKQEEVTFVDITLFGKVAEVAGQYVRKGQPLLVEGRLKTEEWTDKTSGQKRSKLVVIGENIQLLARKEDGQAAAPAPARQTAPAPARAAAPASKIPAGAEKFPSDPDDPDLVPF